MQDFHNENRLCIFLKRKLDWPTGSVIQKYKISIYEIQTNMPKASLDARCGSRLLQAYCPFQFPQYCYGGWCCIFPLHRWVSMLREVWDYLEMTQALSDRTGIQTTTSYLPPQLTRVSLCRPVGPHVASSLISCYGLRKSSSSFQ